MSADNGVYILVTGRGKVRREYRVNLLGVIENLLVSPDFPFPNPVVHLDTMIASFGKCRVFGDRKLAKGYAIRWLEEIENKGGICEYGIKWLEYTTMRFPRHAQPDSEGSPCLPQHPSELLLW